MELKWFLMAMVAWAVLMLAGGAIDNYNRAQCRISGMQAGKTAVEIAEICK